MKKIFSITRLACLAFIFFLIDITTAKANSFMQVDSPAIIGRWDITVNIDNHQSPSWLEVQSSGFNNLIGQFVGVVGSARPVSKINFNNNKFSFSIPPQWEEGNNNLSVEGTLDGDSLSGTMTLPDGKNYTWSAVRAPSLKHTSEPVWKKPITLFDGKDLNGWHANGDNQWIAKDGILSSPHTGANLLTDQTFKDFKLHIEFKCPKGSNSGVYLRGRYEVQIEDNHEGEPVKGVYSAIYGFIEPSEINAKTSADWQSYDITLIGRMVTIAANGKTVICNREIPGITGGAINSKEGEPGPLLIQGDHGPIQYRNIVITPAE